MFLFSIAVIIDPFARAPALLVALHQWFPTVWRRRSGIALSSHNGELSGSRQLAGVMALYRS